MATAESNAASIEDLDFPKAVLTRLIKSSVPDNISIQKEARLGVSKAATVFVSYLAATANDCARESGHKTIMAADVFRALEAVGLGDFTDRLRKDLDAFSSLAKEKKELAQRARAATGEANPGEDVEDDLAEEEEEEEEEVVQEDMDVDDDEDAGSDADESAKRPRTE
ncbi:hypothetical protein H4R26_003505 [Coemansia thaxteri]|uniref:DNA polymerase epsilon subunit D n=1 Tax=Coemansia thaxteri TaxID=2663907 RepID=A0A9W8BIT5_9FUNG|nr:hypothetical protein H4R26_003505 [Coemansia thaxteri]KAJ2482101.1 hypothetical protein EV174_003294 [Coemansia sp. RSA 2320]